jgi:hypothetical protein
LDVFHGREDLVSNHDYVTSLLLPGEYIEWRESSVWARSAWPRQQQWRRVVRKLGWAILFTQIFILSLSFSLQSMHTSSVGNLFAFFHTMLIFAVPYLWVKAAGSVFTLFNTESPRSENTYLLTDRRLMIIYGNQKSITSITRANYLVEAILSRNGSVYNLYLWFGPRHYDDYYNFHYSVPICLQAIERGKETKARIVKRFGPARGPLDKFNKTQLNFRE